MEILQGSFACFYYTVVINGKAKERMLNTLLKYFISLFDLFIEDKEARKGVYSKGVDWNETAIDACPINIPLEFPLKRMHNTITTIH